MYYSATRWEVGHGSSDANADAKAYARADEEGEAREGSNVGEEK